MPGAASTVVLGWETDVEINGILFGVRGVGSLRGYFDKQECGDTISGQQKMNKAGRGEMSATFSFYEKSDLNAMIPPVELVQGSYIQLKVWPKGLDVGEDPWETDFFNVEFYEDTSDVDGKVSGNISGQSSGGYGCPAGIFGPEGLNL
jgi:hypothetical protein